MKQKKQSAIPKSFSRVLTLSLVLLSSLFIIIQKKPASIWWLMSSILTLLLIITLLTDHTFLYRLKEDIKSGGGKKILYGILTASLLYFVFLLGNEYSGRLFHFAEDQIVSIYALSGNLSKGSIMLLLLLVIAPGEELFWRIYVQDNLMRRFSETTGMLFMVILYTGVHLFTGNIMLMLSALVAGLYWGWLYYRFRSPLLNVISHIAWDVTVFLLLPF